MNQYHLSLPNRPDPALLGRTVLAVQSKVSSGSQSSQLAAARTARSRHRGVILTRCGWQKLQDNYVLESDRGDRYTYETLGSQSILSPRTVAKLVSRKIGVDLSTLQIFFRAFDLPLSEDDYTSARKADRASHRTKAAFDLTEAAQVSSLYGRQRELEQLEQWVMKDRCQLVSISGIGGVGKTALIAEFAAQSAAEIETSKFARRNNPFLDRSTFDFVVWKSLRDAPSLPSLLTQVTTFLTSHSSAENSSAEGRLIESDRITISSLLQQFRQFRCLLVLDGWEVLLKSGDRSGVYRQGYEDYGSLLQQIAETQHQSCVVIASREIPREVPREISRSTARKVTRIADLAQTTHQMQLSGLSVSAGQELLQSLGCSALTAAADWQAGVERCGGSPLVLNAAAQFAQAYMGGDVSELLSYLQQDSLLTDEIRDSLKRQFERMSISEQQVLLWLAKHQLDHSLTAVQQAFVQTLSPQDLLLTIDSLQRRSLLNPSSKASRTAQFSLCPIMQTYLVDSPAA